MAVTSNPHPTPADPAAVSPKVAAAALAGLALVALQAVLTAITPETFDFAGVWSPLVYSLVTALGAVAAGYLKSDPARYTTHHGAGTATDPNLRA